MEMNCLVRSKHLLKKLRRWQNYSTFNVVVEPREIEPIETEPISGAYCEEWKFAIKEEYNALIKSENYGIHLKEEKF